MILHHSGRDTPAQRFLGAELHVEVARLASFLGNTKGVWIDDALA